MKYSIEMQLGKEFLKSTGKTIEEALANLATPLKITTKSTVKITDGKRKAEVHLTIPRAKRLFYPIARKIQAKYLDLLMK